MIDERFHVLDVLRIQMLVDTLRSEAMGQFLAEPQDIDRIIEDLFVAKDRLILNRSGGPINCPEHYCNDGSGKCEVCPPTPPQPGIGAARLRRPTGPQTGLSTSGKKGKQSRPRA